MVSWQELSFFVQKSFWFEGPWVLPHVLIVEKEIVVHENLFREVKNMLIMTQKAGILIINSAFTVMYKNL